jgi:hypothetical protein
MNKEGTLETYIPFNAFLEIYRSLPLLYVPMEHDVQGILGGQTIVAIYRHLRVLDDSLDDLSRLTVASFSSLLARQVITELDHELDDEILCKL